MVSDRIVKAIQVAILILLVAVIVIWTHLPVIHAQAISFDDEEAVVKNELIQNPSWHSVGRFFGEVTRSSVVAGYYRPLTLMSFMLDWAMGGRPDDLYIFHRTSLALHVGCTLLIVLLCYQIFGQPVVAAMAGLLFGLHPLTVEPIAWVMERKTLLAAIFAFACLNAYVRYTQVGGKRWYITAVVLYLISLLAKPTVTPLPIMMLLMDYWPLKRLSRRAILEKIPFVILAVIFALLCVLCEQKVNDLMIPAKLSPLHLPLRLCWLAVFYPYKILIPMNLTSVYMLPALSLRTPSVLLAVVLVVATVTVLILYRQRIPALWVSLTIFYVGLSPTMGFVGYSWVWASDKYVYVPAVGIVLLLAWLLNELIKAHCGSQSKWRIAFVGIAVLIAAGLLSVTTRQYIAKWQTTYRHALYMYRLAPESPYANYGYAGCLRDKGDLKQALYHYSRAIEIRSDFIQAYCSRAEIYSGLQDYDNALVDQNMAIELDPNLADAYYIRGNTYNKLKQYDCAIEDYNHAIAINSDFADAYYNRGNAYGKLNNNKRAIEDYGRAIALKPDFTEAHYNRGNAYGGSRDYVRAIQEYSRVVELKPNHIMAYNNRAVSYYCLKQYDKAWVDVRKHESLGGKVDPGFIQALTQATSRPISKR